MAWSVAPTMWRVLFFFLVLVPLVKTARKSDGWDLIEKVDDIKVFKKLLRTHNNVLVIYSKSGNLKQPTMSMFGEVAETIKGRGTIAMVDCSNAKKICKKFKASPISEELKHYKDGEYNKDYDRMQRVKSLVNFMYDPTGDLPWEEDSTATDVLHLETSQQLTKKLKQEKKPLLLMFYAPWCGYCKKLKPEFARAATELKGESILAGIDVDRPNNMEVRHKYNITGFPTLIYFENGSQKYKYGGENNKEGIVNWMRNPTPPKEPEKETEWSEEPSEVVHLTDSTFDDFMLNNPSALVMFYAPWCGHCKKMKPEFTMAAQQLKEQGVEGVLVAVDATKERKVAQQYGVEGYPTVKYFKDGKEAFDYRERTADDIVQFMKDPVEPPPPPPPEASWEETPSEVVHLNDENFKAMIKKKKHALVMFYAPWCGHCKKAKPEFINAAAEMAEDSKVLFGAIDCTKHQSTCSSYGVSGYPTFKYFNYGKKEQKYAGGRETVDFVNFIKDPLNPMASMPPIPPTPEENWANVGEGTELLEHLNEANFDTFMSQNNAVLVMFYAPWCGHCKAMKPEYGRAALYVKNNNINGKLATVDVTIERNLATRFDIKGYPTLLFFKDGEYLLDYEGGRSASSLVEFLRDPKPASERESEPAGSPSQAPFWTEDSAIHHLEQSTFETWMADQSHVLVMFYAPWCGHCKKAKPAFTDAANQLKGTNKQFAAVDCTASGTLCSSLGVSGYPTIQLYSKGKLVQKYEGARSKESFIQFMAKHNPEKAANKKEEL